jgi:hypothetical protein
LPGFSDEREIEELLTALRAVITDTLGRTILFPVADGAPRAPATHESFGKLLDAINECEGGDVCSVITFNYDPLIEFGLFFGNGYDYSLSNDPRSTGRIPLLKLHGSLNWGVCAECRAIVPFHLGDYINRFQLVPRYRQSEHLQLLDFLRAMKIAHCGKAVEQVPVILPPTWNKTEYSPTLTHIWREAASQLSDAENIFVCGYSLPETDAFFKHLFALGAVGNSLIQRFWVFDPDPDQLVEARFRGLLGKAALSRFRMLRQPFSTLPATLSQLLGVHNAESWNRS